MRRVERVRTSDEERELRGRVEVMRSLANKDSPVSRFFTGDVHTLLTDERGEGVVAALKKYHSENYCAGRERAVPARGRVGLLSPALRETLHRSGSEMVLRSLRGHWTVHAVHLTNSKSCATVRPGTPRR